jgi:hypothetical protein
MNKGNTCVMCTGNVPFHGDCWYCGGNWHDEKHKELREFKRDPESTIKRMIAEAALSAPEGGGR